MTTEPTEQAVYVLLDDRGRYLELRDDLRRKGHPHAYVMRQAVST